MIDISKQTVAKGAAILGKQRSYNEITDYLDKHWAVSPDLSLERMKQLDASFNKPSQKLNTIFVAGTNGKSLTIHFATKLLREEGLNVGAYYAPHILTYNERFVLNNEAISNKLFTELGNEVINKAEALGIQAHSSELLSMMALLYFEQSKADVALLEVHEGGVANPVNICHAKIATITRVTGDRVGISESLLNDRAREMMGIIKRDTWLVSGDQNKAMLQLMETMAEAQGGHWAMPIRKLAPLGYPYEQLYGRCAALAERIAQLFVEHVANKNAVVLSGCLLSKPKGMRGRPTRHKQRERELNPERTMEHFWKEAVNDLPGRFELLDKEKPSILLDTANNLDSFENLLLGIRLLHYQRSLKGLTIVVAAAHNTLHGTGEEFVKLVRYFFKKTSGQLFVCPIDEVLPGNGEESSWDAEQVANDAKTMKIKARAFKNFEEAFDQAKKSVDERYGLVVVTGSQSIVNEYWRLKGIKKF